MVRNLSVMVVLCALISCSSMEEIGNVLQLQCNCNIDPQPCCCTTPIVLDLQGDGVQLTSWRDGVDFALVPQRGVERRAWTEAGSDDAWLFLDHTGDRVATDGLELFGDVTEQPKPPAGEHKNGFLALAEHDANHDGVVDARDPVFDDLRLWRDDDHDGVSTLAEVFDLASVGVTGLSVAYKPEMIGDAHGNAFRYSAKVETASGSTVGQVAWDVSLASPTKAERTRIGIPDPTPPLDDYDFVHQQTGKTVADPQFAYCRLKFVVEPPATGFFEPIYAHTKARWEISSGDSSSCPWTSQPTTVLLYQYHAGAPREQNRAEGDRPQYNWIPVAKTCRHPTASLWMGGGIFHFPPPYTTLNNVASSETRTLDCSMYDGSSDFPRCD